MISQQAFEEILESVRKNSIEKLHLNKKGLNSNQIVQLCEALEKNTSVVSLSIVENGNVDTGLLTDEDYCIPRPAALAMRKMLEVNKTLKSLSLYNNSLSPDCVTVIAQGMESNKTVLSLDLGYNNMGIIGMRAIAKMLRVNQVLQKLGLSVNNIDAVCAAEIAQALPVNLGLRDLNLNVNPIGAKGTSALARALEGDKVLKKLSLKSCNINGFQSPKGFMGMIGLMGNMFYYGVGGFFMNQANKVNRWFNLSSRNVTLDGVSALANMLKGNAALQELDIEDNGPWSNEAARNLADALKTNTSLESLSMGSAGGGRAGINALINSLEFNKTLKNWDWWPIMQVQLPLIEMRDLPLGPGRISREDLIRAFFARGGNAKTENNGVLSHASSMESADSKDSQEKKDLSERLSSAGNALVNDGDESTYEMLSSSASATTTVTTAYDSIRSPFSTDQNVGDPRARKRTSLQNT